MPKIILVSLIHNRKDLLKKAVDSALSQTLDKSKWTHLLWDNASTDGAGEVCQDYARNYPHIKVFSCKENLGQQKAFNEILYNWLPNNNPDTIYWVNLDSDDELRAEALAEVEKLFDSNPAVGQAYSGFDIIDGKGKIKVMNHPKARLVPDQFTDEGQKKLRQIFIKQNPVGHLRSFRISSLLDIGGFSTKYQYATDYAIAGAMLQKHKVVKINKVLYRWRQHSQQVERQHSPQQTQDWLDLQKDFTKIFAEKKLI